MNGDGILGAIGRTPLVKLTRLLPEVSFSIYAKLEGFNPGGSAKDRAALRMLQKPLAEGLLEPGDTVIESSSGNMGIGLAQACAFYGLRFLCVTDRRTSLHTLRIMRAYGAEIDMVAEPDPLTGEYLPARLNRVQALLASHPGSFWPNQYANSLNADAHYHTMEEIATTLGGRVDYLFCGTSTCGTVSGCAAYVRCHGLKTRIVVVDARGSVLFGGPKGRRELPGLGASIRPQLCQPALISECIHVTDLDCVMGCRRLLRREAILAGGSSGGVVMAVDSLKERIPPDSNCVLILTDRGERYLDTVYCDAWVQQHLETDPARFEDEKEASYVG